MPLPLLTHTHCHHFLAQKSQTKAPRPASQWPAEQKLVDFLRTLLRLQDQGDTKQWIQVPIREKALPILCYSETSCLEVMFTLFCFHSPWPSKLKCVLSSVVPQDGLVLKRFTLTYKWLLETDLKVFNPLSPKIYKQILMTDLHTFLLRIVERIWFKIKELSLW